MNNTEISAGTRSNLLFKIIKMMTFVFIPFIRSIHKYFLLINGI